MKVGSLVNLTAPKPPKSGSCMRRWDRWRMGAETTVQRDTAASTNSRSITRFLSRVAQVREFGLLVVLAVVIVFFGIQQPRFLAPGNFQQILQSIAIIAIVAVGEALVIITRNVDLSVGAIVGLSAFASADLLKTHQDLNLWLIFLFGCALGAGLGAVNGL